MSVIAPPLPRTANLHEVWKRANPDSDVWPSEQRLAAFVRAVDAVLPEQDFGTQLNRGVSPLSDEWYARWACPMEYLYAEWSVTVGDSVPPHQINRFLYVAGLVEPHNPDAFHELVTQGPYLSDIWRGVAIRNAAPSAPALQAYLNLVLAEAYRTCVTTGRDTREDLVAFARDLGPAFYTRVWCEVFTMEERLVSGSEYLNWLDAVFIFLDACEVRRVTFNPRRLGL